MLDRTIAPDFHPVDAVSFLAPQEMITANGSKAFVFPSEEHEIVRIQWVFANSNFDPKKPLINSAMAGMLLEGTRELTGAEIAEKADFFGAFLQPEYNYDRTTLTLFTLNKHLTRLIPLVYQVLTSAEFPQQELDTYIRNNKQRMRISMEKNDYVARKKFNHLLFGNSRYGYDFQPEDYDTLTREDLLEDYRQKITPQNCTLFISGGIDKHSLAEISNVFGREWKSDYGSVRTSVPLSPAPEGQLLLIEKEKALQSAIRVGYRSIGRSHPDFPGLQLVNTILGGYFGSRLMMNIREDKGYTYGVGSGLGSLEHASFFTVATEVGVEVSAATLKEIEREINRLKEELIDESELALVKNYMLGSLLGSLENIFSHTDKFKQAHYSGLDLSYYQYYTSSIQQISAAQARQLTRKYLDYQKMVKVVVGKL